MGMPMQSACSLYFGSLHTAVSLLIGALESEPEFMLHEFASYFFILVDSTTKQALHSLYIRLFVIHNFCQTLFL